MPKPPELLLAGIVTCDPGTKTLGSDISCCGIFTSCTVAPPAGAGPLSVIMPFTVQGLFICVGVMTRD